MLFLRFSSSDAVLPDSTVNEWFYANQTI